MSKKKIIGLERGKVNLLFYNSKWKELYKREEELLYSSIGNYVLDIQHIGSTSIPGILAKPIIDIAVGLKSLDLVKKIIKPLKSIGYQYLGEKGVTNRHFFVKGIEKNRTHYLHVEKLGSKNWKNHILFRDYLLKNKEAAKEYSQLKRELALKYKNDRDAYLTEKESFIQKIIKRAK